MRRFTILVLALGLALSAAACGKKGPLDRPMPDKKKNDGGTTLVLPQP